MVRLIHVHPWEDPGYRRLELGSGFRYVDAKGQSVSVTDRERISDLVIPPAWREVWIAVDPNAHIQAVGLDDAGRRQYIYHPQWRQRRGRGKFARALLLAAALPTARARVTTALRGEPGDRGTTLAAAFRLLDEAAPRVGSSRYLERHGSRGLCTLRRGDLQIDGDLLVFSYPGKSRQRVLLEVTDHELAAVLTHLRRGRPGSFLLWYRRGRTQQRVTPTEINAYVSELTSHTFTAKDFRTLRGTIVAAEVLARSGVSESGRERRRVQALATRAAAAALGNTPAVARGSYIDPRVFRMHARGKLLDLTVSPETALRRLLEVPSRGTSRAPRQPPSARDASQA